MADEERLRVFVINLVRWPERLERFLADNTMPGPEFVRVIGIEGRTLDSRCKRTTPLPGPTGTSR